MKIIDSHEVERLAVLSLALEPLAKKNGCTSRGRDLRKDLRLVDFQTAAVNSGKYFYELAERIKRTKGQPKVFYDLSFQALNNSTKNIKNKKIISFGLIELLFLIVVSHLVYGGRGVGVIKNIAKVFLHSSEKDVYYKEEMFRIAWGSSRKKIKRTYTFRLGGKNLFEHYQKHYLKGKESGFIGNMLWCDQMLKSLPIACSMYHTAKKYKSYGFFRSLEESFRVGLRKLPRAGTVADFTAVIGYLMLVDGENDKLI